MLQWEALFSCKHHEDQSELVSSGQSFHCNGVVIPDVIPLRQPELSISRRIVMETFHKIFANASSCDFDASSLSLKRLSDSYMLYIICQNSA